MSKSKDYRIPIGPPRWNATDPLAAEHAVVAQLVKDSTKANPYQYSELDLDFSEAGKQIRDADPAASARFVLALVAHAAHYDALGKEVRAMAANEMERINWHHSCPEWEAIWPARQISGQALRRIMRKKLPLGAEHLIKLADWIAAAEWVSDYHYPLKSFAKAVENYGPVPPNETELHASLSRVARALRNSQSKDLPKVAHKIEALLGQEEETDKKESPTPKTNTRPDPALRAPAGSSQVLPQLKEYLGVLPEVAPATIDTIGFDHFPLRSDSSLREEHELINMLLPEVVEKAAYYNPGLDRIEAGRAILKREELARGRVLLALAERCVNANFVPGGGLEDHRCWQSQYAVKGAFSSLLATGPKFERAGLFDLLLYVSALDTYQWASCAGPVSNLITQAEQFAQASPLTPGERHVLYRLRCRSVRTCPFGSPAEEVQKLNGLLADHAFLALVPGEAWSDAVNAELGAMAKPARTKWIELLQHAATATGSRPSAKWLKTANALLKESGTKQVGQVLQRWFSMVNSPRTIRLLGAGFMVRSEGDGTIHDDNATCLRGLVWMAPMVSSPELIRTLGALTTSCYRKIPGVGPRAVKVGNAGVYALSQVEDAAAVGQLALLKVKVKFGSAQKEIEKAFNAAAERSGLPRDEIEEMSVPSYGLTDVGICEETMGEFTARLKITGTTSTELEWVKSDGKLQKGVPASVKANHKEELKELQAAAKDIQSMLPAQRERIDGLFLQQKSWPLPIWRERYLNHPLIGTLARRLLWEFKNGDQTATGIWFKDALVDLDLKPVSLTDAATVELWHPIGKTTEEVVAWRSWLDAQQIQQPFKQAHREIYVLTDAELNTRIYSNRYAAHVIKQHQFNALCALRGWKNKLRLMVDDEYPPASLALPRWGLRAEFWVEGIGQNYGNDTNESGVFLRLSTDQVRFYRIEAAQRTAHAGGGGYHPGYRNVDSEPVPLSEIPPLVLSEVMRDVDMFVGVASVGNDPTWNDGGPEGRYRDYWQNYSFGDLNASAKTRKDVLQRLIPRLKIAAVCTFDDKFLVVRGQLRTYKIHLGSGNILMAPNDQYLCIVPKQGEQSDDVLLPFEGDRTLSVILSKAFLLAADTKIKDETITRQIQQR